MKIPTVNERDIRSCTRAITIYVAVSENCALPPVTRSRAANDAFAMSNVRKLLYKIKSIEQPLF